MTEEVKTEENEDLTKEELAERLKTKLPYVRARISKMVNTVKRILEANPDGIDEAELLADMNDANEKSYGEISTALLAVATLELAKKELENAQPISRFDDGTVILAALNIDEEDLRVSSDIMRQWAALYSVMHGGVGKARVSQIQVDGMLFLVVEKEEQDKPIAFGEMTFTGEDARHLDKLFKEDPSAFGAEIVKRVLPKLPEMPNSAKEKLLDAFAQNTEFDEQEPLPGLPGVRVFTYGFPRDTQLGDDEVHQ